MPDVSCLSEGLLLVCNFFCFLVIKGAMASSSEVNSVMGAEDVANLADMDCGNVMAKVLLGSGAPAASHDESAAVEDSAQVTCIDCGNQVAMDDATIVGGKGRAKKVYKCKKCGALRGRMQRLFTKRGEMADDWMAMAADTQKEFLANNQALSGSELEKGITMAIAFSRRNSDGRHVGAEGLFLPLSVYTSRGYSETHIQNIEKTCPKKWDPALGDHVYQLMVDESGEQSTETVQSTVMYTPVNNRGAEASGDEGDQDGSARKRPKKNQPQNEEVAKQKEAEKLTRIQDRTNKMLANKIVKILKGVVEIGNDIVRGKVQLPDLQTRIPQFMRDECQVSLEHLERQKALWTDVLIHGAVHKECMALDGINNLKKQATKSFTDLAAMIKLVDGNK